MSIQIKQISQNEFEQLVAENKLALPIWIRPSSVICYKEKEILSIYYNGNFAGIYVVPVAMFEGKKIVERGYRFFPFLSPIILETNLEKRRNIIIELFKYIFTKYDAMYMPFAPDFTDVAGIAELGAFFECRHTQMITKKLTEENMTSKLRNHIKKAKSQITIKIEEDINLFNFDIAIKGNVDERLARKNNAQNLLNNGSAKIINAYQDGKIVAGIFICYDNNNATYLHSWQNKCTPRGTISCLLYEAINFSFDILKVKAFDLEGSVMFSIDKFFNNFNGTNVIYPYLHFAKDYNYFEKLINISKDIDGRVSENFGGINGKN